MRTALAFIIAAALLATPLAVARAPPPAFVAAVIAPGAPIMISWSPVPGADAYVVFAGVDAENFEPVATVHGNFYVLEEGAQPSTAYGVASIVHGVMSGIHQAGASDGGDCVAANSNGRVAVMVSNCMEQ